MRTLALTLLGAALFMGGCATANPIRMAEAAPVTQKAGEGSVSYAAVRLPKRAFRQMPATTPAPQLAAPVAPRTVQPSTPQFDQAHVDAELYAHQRVGKTYKVFGKTYTPRHQPAYDVTGTASWYGPKFHGKPTASGEVFDMHGLTVAHKTLPLNSLVHVLNMSNGKSLVLRVNDRGPFVGKRIIDLSKGAADQLGLLESGLKEVRVRYAGPADPNDIGKTTRKPKPSSRPAPAMVAEVPNILDAPIVAPDTDSYTPLRSLPGRDYTPLAALPETQRLPQPQPQPLPKLSGPIYDAPVFDVLPEVQADVEDGPMTLTIKGPIHLAKSLRMRNPEFVRPAGHR